MWVVLSGIFSPHGCQNMQYHSLLKCVWHPRAGRHSVIKILLWLFSELDFFNVLPLPQTSAVLEFFTVREFWFSLSPSLWKKAEDEGEEEKTMSFLQSGPEMYGKRIWWGPSPAHPVPSLGCQGSHLLVCAGLEVDAEMKTAQKVCYRGTCESNREEAGVGMRSH